VNHPPAPHRRAAAAAVAAIAASCLSAAALAGGNQACPGSGFCSIANGTPGCNDPACCNLVCDDMPDCCNFAWDQDCADHAILVCDLICGAAGTGSCFAAGQTPGCDNPECCEFVCSVIDPFCCEAIWDQGCADDAFVFCPIPEPQCGAPQTGDCFEANGSPFCDDQACCDTVCAVDPFCCDVTWDAICAEEAAELCACGPEQVPANDLCVDAIPIGLGTTAISNECATAQAPSHASCTDSSVVGLGLDIWYTFASTFTGTLTVSTCNQVPAEWDTQMSAYEGTDCGDLSDPPLACAQPVCAAGRIMEVPVRQGVTYLIRIGGTLFDPVGAGTVTLAQGGFDPCELTIPPSATAEPEACGQDQNGGCNSTPAAFTDVTLGTLIHGTSWAAGGLRDTDWYRLVLSKPTEVTLTMQSEFASRAGFIVQVPPGAGTCAAVIDDLEPELLGGNCAELSAVAMLPAGTHIIYVSTTGFDGVPCVGQSSCCFPHASPGCDDASCQSAVCAADPFCCSSNWDGLCALQAADLCGGLCGGGVAGLQIGNDYLLGIEGPELPCPADTNGSGIVDVQDLVAVITSWGTSNAAADVNDDGVVNVQDLVMVITGWGPCP
jgi:hypothetical protein